MTMIFDASDEIIAGFVTPKDDAGMSIIKGNVNSSDATSRPSVYNSTDNEYTLNFGSESYSGQIDNWQPISTVGNAATLGTDSIEQTRTSASGTAQQATWHYEREL
jgi:hypothetical protein